MASTRYVYLLLAALAPAVQAQPTQSLQSRECAARDAAAGFTMTGTANLQEILERHCGTLPGDDGNRARAAYTAWLKRNAQAIRAANLHLESVTGNVSTHQGRTAAQALGRARLERSAADAARARETLFPSGATDPETRDIMTSRVMHGDGDLRRHAEFGPTLLRIEADAEAGCD